MQVSVFHFWIQVDCIHFCFVKHCSFSVLCSVYARWDLWLVSSLQCMRSLAATCPASCRQHRWTTWECPKSPWWVSSTPPNSVVDGHLLPTLFRSFTQNSFPSLLYYIVGKFSVPFSGQQLQGQHCPVLPCFKMCVILLCATVVLYLFGMCMWWQLIGW